MRIWRKYVMIKNVTDPHIFCHWRGPSAVFQHNHPRWAQAYTEDSHEYLSSQAHQCDKVTPSQRRSSSTVNSATKPPMHGRRSYRVAPRSYRVTHLPTPICLSVEESWKGKIENWVHRGVKAEFQKWTCATLSTFNSQFFMLSSTSNSAADHCFSWKVELSQ